MSIRYKLASAALRAAGTKKLFALPEEELLEKVRGMNRRRQFQMPKDHISAHHSSGGRYQHRLYLYPLRG